MKLYTSKIDIQDLNVPIGLRVPKQGPFAIGIQVLDGGSDITSNVFSDGTCEIIRQDNSKIEMSKSYYGYILGTTTASGEFQELCKLHISYNGQDYYRSVNIDGRQPCALEYEQSGGGGDIPSDPRFEEVKIGPDDDTILAQIDSDGNLYGKTLKIGPTKDDTKMLVDANGNINAQYITCKRLFELYENGVDPASEEGISMSNQLIEQSEEELRHNQLLFKSTTQTQFGETTPMALVLKSGAFETRNDNEATKFRVDWEGNVNCVNINADGDILLNGQHVATSDQLESKQDKGTPAHFQSLKISFLSDDPPLAQIDGSGNISGVNGSFNGNLTKNGVNVATVNDIPTVPTKTSDLTNDSGFITEADLVKTPTPKVLPDYLYQLNFDSDYEDYGTQWRKEHFETIDIGGCSTVRKNNLVGRNYDYEYTDAATFVVKLPNRVVGASTKYASVGVATLGTQLTKTMVESGNYTDLYKALPGMTTDGINEKGLQVAIHLVPSDTTKDAGWTGDTIDAFGAVRYVLDTFDDAQQAAQWLAQNVYLPDKYVTETGYSVQFIVSAYNQNTYIVQDGRAVAFDTTNELGILTNYRLFNIDSITPETERSVVGTYDPYGQGLERMSLIQNGLETLYSAEDMSLLMESLYFTNAYSELTSNPWYSEFVSKDDERTLLSPDSDFTTALTVGRLAYNVRDRFNPSHVEYEGETYDVTTWQTVHTSIYNLESKTLSIVVQEDSEEYVFKCDKDVGDIPEIPTKTSDLINDSGFIVDTDVKKLYNQNEQQYLDSNGEHYHYSSEYGTWTFNAVPEFTVEGELEMEEERTEAEYVYTLKFVKPDTSYLILQTTRRTTPLTQFSYSNIDVDDGVMHVVDGRRDGIGWNKDWTLVKTTDLPTKVSDLENDVPFANKDDVDEKFEEVDLAIDGLATGYSEITEKIPTQATRQNQLADKAFVNSSIATNTGTFKGTFNSTSELPTTGVNPNDYAFVISTDTAGNTVYNRYKYSTEWVFEYSLNNSAFTAVQWATINGGPYAKPEDIPENVSDLTNDSGFITNTVQGQAFSVKNAAGTTTYFSASSNGVYKNGKIIATVDQLKDPDYKYDQEDQDISFLILSNKTLSIPTTSSDTWTITIDDASMDTTNSVFDSVVFIKELGLVPMSVTVENTSLKTCYVYGDDWSTIDEAEKPYIITFTVIENTDLEMSVLVKIQKLDSIA